MVPRNSYSCSLRCFSLSYSSDVNELCGGREQIQRVLRPTDALPPLYTHDIMALDFTYALTHLSPTHPPLSEPQCQLFSTLLIDLIRLFILQPEICHYGIGALLVIYHQTRHRPQLSKPFFLEISHVMRHHRNVLYIHALSTIMAPIAVDGGGIGLDPVFGARFSGGGVYAVDKSGLLEEDEDLEGSDDESYDENSHPYGGKPGPQILYGGGEGGAGGEGTMCCPGINMLCYIQ